ncbi:unnamed protein product, partial [Pylaiella littoralis]
MRWKFDEHPLVKAVCPWPAMTDPACTLVCSTDRCLSARPRFVPYVCSFAATHQVSLWFLSELRWEGQVAQLMNPGPASRCGAYNLFNDKARHFMARGA